MPASELSSAPGGPLPCVGSPCLFSACAAPWGYWDGIRELIPWAVTSQIPLSRAAAPWPHRSHRECLDAGEGGPCLDGAAVVGEAGISCRALLWLVHAHGWVRTGRLCSVLLPPCLSPVHKSHSTKPARLTAGSAVLERLLGRRNAGAPRVPCVGVGLAMASRVPCFCGHLPWE